MEVFCYLYLLNSINIEYSINKIGFLRERDFLSKELSSLYLLHLSNIVDLESFTRFDY